jgi:uncharacterized SAM-binding protein YcdF (DUF218 family)
MLSGLSAAGSWLSYPPCASVVLVVAGFVVSLRFRRTGRLIAIAALAWSLLWSVPVASDWLRGTLESRHPVVAAPELPRADAIVVLGGATSYRWMQRERVDPWQMESSRLAAAARAWLSARAPVVILSGGNGGREGSEAARMRTAILRLGVPEHVIVLEEHSRNTEDNARNSARVARNIGVQRILLVTSSLHMPRALRLFRNTGLDVIPVPVPERALRRTWRDRWLPSPSALWRSGRAIKEYTALLALTLQDHAK